MRMYNPDELPFPERDLIYFTAYQTRAQLLLGSSVESCMMSSRLVSEVYRAMGLTCMPLVVQVTAMNAEAWKAAQEEGKVELYAGPDDPAYACQIRHDPSQHSETALQGHVTVIVSNRYLVDASIDQLTRKARNLYVEPFIADFTTSQVSLEDFLGGEQVALDLPKGGGLIYEAHPEDLAYLEFVDWEPIEDDPRTQAAFDATLGLVQVALDNEAFPPLPALPSSISTQAIHIAQKMDEMPDLSPEEKREAWLRNGFDPDELAQTVEQVRERMGVEEDDNPHTEVLR